MHDFKNLTLTCRQLWAFQNVPMAIKTYMRLKPFLAHIYGAPLKEWVMEPTMSGNLCLRLRQDVAMRLVQELMDQGKASTIYIGNLMHKDFWFHPSQLRILSDDEIIYFLENGLAKPENALAAAVAGNDIYRARLLSEKYPDAVKTAMGVAIHGGALMGESLDMLKLLIAAGGNPATYLYRTVECIDTVQFLLEHIHDQERPTVEGLASALFEAVCLNNMATSKLLLDFGADPCYWIPETVRDTRHKLGVDHGVFDVNPVSAGAGLGNFELVQLLLERGGVVTNGSLKYAIRSGDLNLVNFMLSHGTQMDYKSFMALGQTGSRSAWNEWLRWMRKVDINMTTDILGLKADTVVGVDFVKELAKLMPPPTSEVILTKVPEAKSMLSSEAFEFLRIHFVTAPRLVYYLVISANGNSGSKGTFTGRSPGAAAGGLGIASFDNLQVPKPFVKFSAVKHQFNIGGNNGNFDFTKDYMRITPAAAGKALLIRWGGVSSNARCTAAARAGAIACILYANTDSIPNIAGSLLIPSLATTHDLARSFDLATAGTVSDFSSLGLDLELAIKPDLGGIGGEVYSTVFKHSQEAGGLKAPYAVYGGTSMATPYVAGVSALLLQALGRSRPTFDEFRTLLQNTANFAKKHDSDLVDSVAYQGAGLINAYAAITSKTTNINQHYKLTVTNKNTRSIDYTIKHQPALQLTPSPPGDDATLGAVDQAYTADYATVQFSRNNDKVDTLTFTLAAGASRSFNVFHVQPPSNAIQGLFPIYSGYVVVDADGDKVASVPYAGVVGNYKEAPIWVKKTPRAAAALTDLGLTPALNATLTTGVYDLYNGFASTIPENSVHNLTEAGLLVIPIVATSSRFARVEAIYKGRDWSALTAANVSRKTQLHLIGTSIPLNPDATGAISPGGIANLYANPLQRNHYDGDSRPTAYYFEGSVLSNLTDPDAALFTLPAGKYQIRFTASSTLDVSTPPLPETTLTLSTPTPLTLSTKPLPSKKL
ncbi:hypothetical protein BC829DRAFT_493226 [Chytridium lagenaria]|nr:hypothetical protein BC829DRAFT_493226 [Chytridium lagenaria]